MERRIGEITHYYNNIGVAVLNLRDELSVGDRIHVIGHTTDLLQTVESMEIDREKVQTAGPDDDVALKVDARVREGDELFLVSGDEVPV